MDLVPYIIVVGDSMFILWYLVFLKSCFQAIFVIILMKELFMRMFPGIDIPGWDEWLTYNCGTWNVISIGITKGLGLHM